MYPNEARMRNLSYSSHIFCDIVIDCAPKEAFKKIIEKCLKYKTKLITVSGAGILENLEF